jgi:hypothetical protein
MEERLKDRGKTLPLFSLLLIWSHHIHIIKINVFLVALLRKHISHKEQAAEAVVVALRL